MTLVIGRRAPLVDDLDSTGPEGQNPFTGRDRTILFRSPPGPMRHRLNPPAHTHPESTRRRGCGGSRHAHLPGTLFLGLVVSLACMAVTPATRAATTGLPVARIHSLDEVGSVSAGARLGFDPIGRIAVVQDNIYAVLNDRSWVHLADESGDADMMTHILLESADSGYYGSVGSWGRVAYSPEGKLRPVSLRPSDCPVWVQSTNFIQIFPVDDGVFFAGWTGAVYWDRETGAHFFFEVPELLRVFKIGGDVYLTSRVRGLMRVDLQSRTLQPVNLGNVDAVATEWTATLSDGRVLGATKRRGLFVLDGESATPWAAGSNPIFANGISSICRLAEGGIAIAVDATGLFILSEEGALVSSFTSAEYHAIRVVTAREPGILWLASDLGIQQVFYGSSASVIDQRLGLPIGWPQVVQWNGNIVVSSHGRLYEAVPDSPGRTTRFQLITNQRPDGSWAIGALGDQLLIGNKDGVYVREASGTFTTVLTGIDVARLVMIAPNLCYALGMHQIAALHFEAGKWVECADRVPGFGYPAIVHAAHSSAWIELGANRVARVTLKDGQLQTRLIDSFPWSEPRWVNIGVIGDLVVLSGPEESRVFFDETRGDFRPAPEAEAILNRSPLWIARMREDSTGTIWASHNHGVLKLVREGDDYRVDLGTVGTIRDRYPIIQILENDDVWIATGSALYHVEPSVGAPMNREVRPILESIADARTGRLLAPVGHASSLDRLAYAENSISLRFFAGTYSVRSPTYQFRMTGPSTTWSLTDADSLLTLPDLKEGRYHLDVQLTDSGRAVGAPLSVTFEIAPPWFRTTYAYFAYALGSLALVYGLVSWSVHRTRAHNAMLARKVQEKTDELRVTMQKLNEETRHAATLAERGRLAGEIHDSLQQGLSGLMLHLDATLKLPGIGQDLRARLSMARNMVSFTRHEVQHAVWDMESPLVNHGDLGDSLRKIAALINSSEARVEIDVTGKTLPLSSAKTHHLLRIAQEAMTNSVRHGAAGNITIHLAYEADTVSLTISDNGRGFNPQEVLSQGAGHFGLRGMRGRAGKVNGDLSLHSEPGQGTSIAIRVPITEDHA